MGNYTVNSVIVMDGETTSQLLFGLMKGTTYEVTIVACNLGGKSLSSEPLRQRTAVDCELCTCQNTICMLICGYSTLVIN